MTGDRSLTGGCVLVFSKAWQRWFSKGLDTDFGFLCLVGLWKEIRSLQEAGLTRKITAPKDQTVSLLPSLLGLRIH